MQVQITIDGFVSGPNGEMDWMTWNWDNELKDHVTDLTEPVDCIVMGRKLAEGFIPHWAGVAADPDNPEYWAGRKFTDTHKVVFSKTLESSPWENASLAKGDLADEINKLKNAPGEDIIVYGGVTFVSSLIRENLIDEYNLFVNPAAIGKGMPIFDKLEKKMDLELVGSKAYECGIVVMRYGKKG